MNLGFEKIDWTRDFKTPFPRSPPGASDSEEDGINLRGLARKLIITNIEFVAHVVIDDGREFHAEELRGVVIGKDKVESEKEDPKHYVLLIRETSESPDNIYERVGVAPLKAANLCSEGSWVSIR
jgi:hypothetical protein